MGQGPAGHQDDGSSQALDEFDLLLIGADDVVEGVGSLRVEVIGAAAASNSGAGDMAGGVKAGPDQRLGVSPP